jgi:hypothetical protein
MQGVSLKFSGTLRFRTVLTHPARHQVERSHVNTIAIDLNEVEFANPCGIVTMAAWVEKLVKGNKKRLTITADRSPAFEYMQNMNLFRPFNLYKDESFNRHPPDGRFCRMARVAWDTPTDKVAEELAQTLQVPSEGPLINDLLTCLSESLSNIQAHARAAGYGMAQSFKRSQPDCWYELAICDFGRGIHESLTENPEYSKLKNKEAIDAACRERVSRCKGDSNADHFGVGLWNIDTIASSSGGRFYCASGTNVRIRDGNRVYFEEIPYWRGTLIALQLPHGGIISAHQASAAQTGRLRRG